MTRLIFYMIFLIGFSPAMQAQNEGKFVYTEVIAGPGADAGQLYKTSLDWVALHYTGQNTVVETRDPTHGYFKNTCSFKDTFKYIMPGSDNASGSNYANITADVSYTLELQVSAGKCLITISGLRFKYFIPGNTLANLSDTAKTVARTFEDQYQTVTTKMADMPAQKKTWTDFFDSADRRLKAVISSYKKSIADAASDKGSAF